ncbi:alpha-amylase [Streptomyces sp. NPDC057623]|uniref:alpha-amylase n=1 Tax=Streptomyces sp. NPDC057623 TaxID=3346187 RepID=UPI00369F4646
MRSTFIALTAALCVQAACTAASAAPQAADSRESAQSTQEPVTAPDCVHLTVDWRYTFATNDCSSTYTLRVVYLDGTDVPCRTAAPGALITFPGRGTQGNDVLRAVLCDSDA